MVAGCWVMMWNGVEETADHPDRVLMVKVVMMMLSMERMKARRVFAS